MEVIDQKSPGVVCVSNTSPTDDSQNSSIAKAETAVMVGGENGTVQGEEKNNSVSEGESALKLKEDSNKASAAPKPSEPVSLRQHNTKSGDLNSKRTREDKYSRRKDERSVEQVMRALNNFESPQEKLEALVKKYAEIFDENRKLQTQTKNLERRLTQVEREKDSAQSEHSKSVLARSRLEGLCRELQRQNRAIKEESVLKIREEEEKRKEVSNKFQSTLAEITSLMQQNNEKNSKLRDDNIEMTTKFKSVCEQYELRVQQVEKISKQMQLEAQLADAKLAKAHLEAKAEKEGLLREKHELLMELAQYQARAKEQQETELRLREQVDLYTKKYDEFQTALSRSNEVFGGFKEEMDKMSKKIVKLEKETSTWKLRWEKSHVALLEMAADKQQRDADLALVTRQLNQLDKLCRTLSEERTKLMAQLNTTATPSDAEKEEKFAAEIAEDRRKLNETLDSLQSVILERELLHKQQILEKQQHQLQVALKQHMASASDSNDPLLSRLARMKGKVNDVQATDRNAAELKDSKPVEEKAANVKNGEGGKKKGKKQKSGRHSTEKSVAEDAKPESTETGTKKIEAEGSVKSESGSAPSNKGTSSVEPALDSNQNDHAQSVTTLSSTPLIVETSEKKAESAVNDCTLPSNSEPKVEPLESETTAGPPVTDTNTSPTVFSYAAAVSSKPTEQPSKDKCLIDKTEEKPPVPTNDLDIGSEVINVSQAVEPVPAPSPNESVNVLSTVEATEATSKPIESDIIPPSKEDITVTSPTSPSSKKSKDSGKKRKK